MSRRHLALYYAALALAVLIVVLAVAALAQRATAEEAIAGTYNVIAGQECVGRVVAIRQSGEFVTLQRSDDSSAGRLRLRSGRLTGTVNCSDGAARELRAAVGGERVRGTLGERPFAAVFADEPPEPGAQPPRAPGSITGDYRLTPTSLCLGGSMAIVADGRLLEVEVSGRPRGALRYATSGEISGSVTCAREGRATVAGEAANRELRLTLMPAGAQATIERVTAQKQREFGSTLATFFLAVLVVMLFARLAGELAVRIHQPRVMGEVAAGIILGPTVFGALLPELQRALFPSDIVPYIGVAANLGLIFYMFLVGLELDLSQLHGRVTQTAVISNTGVVIPMIAGLLVAVPVYELVGPEGDFLPFALFMGVSMSITAFPVLARILVERRMLKRPLGALALASAAIDDVTAWFLIAVAAAVAVAGSGLEVLRTVLLAFAFCAVMVLVVRRLLARMSAAYEEAGRVPSVWITAILAGVLFSAYTTEEIGVALIFGAFIMGAVMPRHAGLTEDVTRRLEDFVVLLLLPLFFCFTGLRTDVLLLDNAALILLTCVLIVVAIACKFGGTILAARITGLGWRESAVVGTLMNTRGLTELIVLNLALEMGVISEALFAALVLMALVTTFMAGPTLNRLDPENRYGAPVEDDLRRAKRETQDLTPIRIPERSVLIAPQTDAAVDQLVALAEPLARSHPAREIIVVRLVAPPAGVAVRGGLQTESRLLADATARMQRLRSELLEREVPARVLALSTLDSGADLTRLADQQEVELVLLDGRRPLLGEGVPRGAVRAALEHASSDVAVLVAREDATIALGPDGAVLVPFGGRDHDWAALELGAWLAAATDARLQLLGPAGETDSDVERVLADTTVLVERFVGVDAEFKLVPPGRQGILQATTGAGLLVVGLSDRWREEGLGTTRADIARGAAAPVLFVRRGMRPGALAPRSDVTRFTWSSPSLGGRA
jgi:Kef-type K+ transport system membrane component KefB